MNRAIVWKRGARVFVLVLVLMFGVAVWGVISVARGLAPQASGSADFTLLGMRMFEGTKDGNVSTLQPEAGALLVLAVPVLAAAITVALSMLSGRRPRAGEASGTP